MKIVTVGRLPGNNVVISDPLVSDYHLQIIQDDDGNFRIIDCNSENGTFVNNIRVYGEMPLNRYDVIRIGRISLPWIAYFPERDMRKKDSLLTINIGQTPQSEIRPTVTINSCVICSIGLLIAFFLPWITIPGLDISGYEIPLRMNNISAVFMGSSSERSMLTILTFASYLLYLIPLFAVIDPLSYFGIINNRHKYIEFRIALIGCIVLVIFLVILLNKSFYDSNHVIDQLFALLGPGFYCTFGISVWGLMASGND
jgi:hypothetical protein